MSESTSRVAGDATVPAVALDTYCAVVVVPVTGSDKFPAVHGSGAVFGQGS